MRFNVNNTMSTERAVHGGSPQGTRLGNFLFITTINTIEDSMDLIPPSPSTDLQDEEEEHLDDVTDSYGLRRMVGRIGAVRRFDSGVVHPVPHTKARQPAS